MKRSLDKARSLADMRRECKLGKSTRSISHVVGGSRDKAKAVVKVSRVTEQLHLFDAPTMQSPQGERGCAVGSLNYSLAKYYGG